MTEVYEKSVPGLLKVERNIFISSLFREHQNLGASNETDR